MDTMEFLMQLLGAGNTPPSDMPAPTPPGGMGGGQLPQPGGGGQIPMFNPPPPQTVTAPTPQPAAPTMSPGPAFEQSGRGSPMMPPGLPGQPPLPMPKPGMIPPTQQGISPEQLAAFQALEAPQNENQGPPDPPGAPSGAAAIDPGMLIEALMRLGISPAVIPQLTQQLKG